VADRYVNERLGKWEPIPGFPGYEAARCGLVRSVRRGDPQLLRTSRHRDGYDKVNVYVDGRSRTFHVHTLIALTFLGPRPPYQVIDHIDGNHENNNVDNLRYLTITESNKNRGRLGKGKSHTEHRNVFRHGLGGYYVRVYVSKRLGRYATIDEAVAARDAFLKTRKIEASDASEDGVPCSTVRNPSLSGGV